MKQQNYREEETIVVLDFGGQYSQLIVRRVRECNVYCEILPYDTSFEEIMCRKPAGIIFTGGPFSVYGKDALQCDTRIYECGVPILGICYGMQLMAKNLGGVVSPAHSKEYGKAVVKLVDEDKLFKGLTYPLYCWMSHGDLIEKPPPGFKVTMKTKHTPVAAIADVERNFYGVQFHPEVRHTPWGMQIIRNFLFDVCRCSGNWTMESFIEMEVERVKKEVGEGKALCALSGGVDSAVAALLVHRALGEQLTCIFVDHGLLREGEAKQVLHTFRDCFKIKLIYVDAAQRFLKKLTGVVDPEKKRKLIGEEFIRVFEEEAEKIGDVDYLVQGTLYSDVIESGTATASTIKSHHNVGGLPENMNLKLIEPLKMLFKDEVRKVGLELGLPESVVWRQPFPGPGLAIRILGEVTSEKLQTLRRADAIVTEEIRSAGLEREIWQSFAVLLSMKSVGVMGDERTYAYPIVLRAVTSHDAMTADWARLPAEVLERISSRIVNEVDAVNRVLYDITSKPPATIEWE